MVRSKLSEFSWALTAAAAFLLPFVLIGCSEQASDKAKSSSNQTLNTITSSAVKAKTAEQNAIAQPANGFLTAIIAGRQQQAKQWLTPTAQMQVEANNELLNPLGFQVEKLELGRVVTISQDDAAVEFLLVEAGGNHSEEVCCLMKRSQSGWGVAGIACEAGLGKAPSVISFEHGRRTKVSEPKPKPSLNQYVERSGVSDEIRTANESGPTVR